MKLISKRRLDTLLNSSSSVINRLTDFTPVELAKQQVAKADAQFSEVRKRLQSANEQRNVVFRENAALQSEINGLLHKKQNWTSHEVGQFTDLCQRELSMQKMSAKQQSDYGSAERDLELFQNAYIDALRNHYNEEQIWTEKSRKLSVYFSSILFILNTLLFTLSIMVFEPFKRRKIVNEVSTTLRRELDVEFAKLTSLIESQETSRIEEDVVQKPIEPDILPVVVSEEIQPTEEEKEEDKQRNLWLFAAGSALSLAISMIRS